MAHIKNQIVGLIRFSYLASSGGWNIQTSAEKHKEQLFDTQRMALRLRLFEKLTLPSLAYQQAKDTSADLFTSFRLDDDDMLQKTYIENLKYRVETTHALIEPNKPLVTSFNSGLFLEKSVKGNIVYDVVERTPGAQGTAMTTLLNEQRNVFTRNHRKLPAFFRTVSYTEGPVWLRTLHSNNIANPKITGRSNLVEPNEAKNLLKVHFDLSMDDIDSILL